MMSFFSRSKAASAPVVNGKNKFNQTKFNNASTQLKTALSTIANQHVLKYANAIRANAKAQANAARATANAAAAPTPTNVTKAKNAANNAATTQQNMIESGKAAEAVVTAVPNPESVSVAVVNAEAAAANAVSRNAAALANFNSRIAAANKRNTLSSIETNIMKYANNHSIPFNRNNVRQRLTAINAKKQNNLT